MVKTTCRVPFKDRKRNKDLILMLSLGEAIDQLIMASSVHWYEHILRRKVMYYVMYCIFNANDCA